MNNRSMYSTLMVVAAAALWGIGGGVGGLLIGKGWDPIIVATYRAFLALILVFGWRLIMSENAYRIRGSTLMWGIVAGIGMSGNIGFYFISIAELNVPIAATLMYTAPVFAFILSAVFGLERLTPLKLVSLPIVMVGIVLLTGLLEADLEVISVWGVFAGILSGISYAVYTLAFKKASVSTDALSLVSVAMLVNLLTLTIFADKTLLVQSPFDMTDDLFWIAGLGLFCAGFSYIFYVKGLYYVEPGIASIIGLVEPIVAALFGVVILGDRISFVQSIGLVIVLVTITGLQYYYAGGRKLKRS